MPEPLSWKIGLGMNVSDLPWRRATFFSTYLNVISWSAPASSVLNLVPISPWPPLATSWWCSSTSMPSSISVAAISERRSW